jgi:hypothetical protein
MHAVVSELQYMGRWADMGTPLCIHFMSFGQNMYKNEIKIELGHFNVTLNINLRTCIGAAQQQI